MTSCLTSYLILSFVAVMNGQQFRCDYRFFPEADGWLKLHRVPANWFEARLRCHLEGFPLWKIPHTWALGEPDNIKDEESCIAMLPLGNVADVNCHERLPYFCYKKHTKIVFNNRCGTTDKEYVFDSRTGSCYKFHTVPRTWSRAYMTCAAEGGYLAIINSEVEAQVIKEIFAEHPSDSLQGNFWKDAALVGFHDWKEHGEWLTIHGETLKESG
ncbi:unnamed protein product [Parnassius apollo]|uniref:(apollo) hypothetical protein n=1 Tax=Parnassius apollo TaxID=110799 RepID=A0A8S3XTK6_PARAO|nr:unnamed protein product [Parnassius apollo]